MTTINEARRTIYDEFDANFSPPAPALGGVTFENDAFNPEAMDEWVRLSVRTTDSAQHTLGRIGNRRYRRRGLVFIQIYTTANQGLRRFDELTRAARDVFEGKTISQVWFEDGIVQNIGVVDSKYLGTVSIAFSHDETK